MMQPDDVKRALRFGGKEHERVREAIRERYRMSKRALETRHTKWRADEARFQAFVPETEAEANRKALRATTGQPQQTNLIVPYTYAIQMTMHTYLSSVYLGRDPIFQFEGTDSGGAAGKMALESAIRWTLKQGKSVPRYYLHLMDLSKYGMAVTGSYWEERFVRYKKKVSGFRKVGPFQVPDTEEIRYVEAEHLKFAGTRVYNVRPFNFFPDTRRSLFDYQEGEFCIVRIDDMSMQDVMEGDQYFNKEFASRSRRGQHDDPGHSATDRPIRDDDFYEPMGKWALGVRPAIEAHIWIQPKKWGLGDEDKRELWVFTLFDDEIIVEAQPCDYMHGEFPYDMQVSEMNAHDLGLRSPGETVEQLQYLLDWLVNAHYYNVRKALNDQFLVDPSMVRVKDLKDPEPGNLILLKPEAYGMGQLDQAVRQFKTVDVTASHLNDLGVVGSMMQRASGVMDNVMGMQSPNSRRSATEAQAANSMSINRLKTLADFGSEMYWGPHAIKHVQNMQQYMDKTLQVRISGDSLADARGKGLKGMMEITPEDIVGAYEFQPVDGTLPIDRMAQAQMWKEMVMLGAQLPGVMETYDMGGIYTWVGEMMGLRGLRNFKLQVTDEEVLLAQLKAGVMVGHDDYQSNLRGPGEGFTGGGGGPEDGAVPSTPTDGGAGLSLVETGVNELMGPAG